MWTSTSRGVDLQPADLEALIGRPFRDGGRGPEAFDCWGLVIRVRGLGGLATPDYDCSFRQPAEVSAAARQAKAERLFMPVPEGAARACDIVEYKPVDGHLHFGVMIDGVSFLEIVDDGAGVRLNRLDNTWTRAFIAGVWRDR